MDKRIFGVALLAVGLLCSPLMAAKKHHKKHHADAPGQTDEASDSPSNGPDLENGTWGLGLGYLPAPGLGIPPQPLVTIPTLSGDVWLLNGRLALEGSLGFGTFEGSSFTGVPGTNSGDTYENSATNDFGLSVGARYVVFRPSKYLLFEGIGRLAYTNEYGVIPVLGVEEGEQTGTVGLYLGAGLEAFLPFLPNVSFNLDTGLNALLASSNGVGSAPSFSQDEFWLGGGGFGLPFTFAIHSYF